MGAAAAMALGLKGDVELAGEGDSWQRQVHAFCLIQHDSHVLNKVLHEEAGVEIAGDKYERLPSFLRVQSGRRKRRAFP